MQMPSDIQRFAAQDSGGQLAQLSSAPPQQSAQGGQQDSSMMVEQAAEQSPQMIARIKAAVEAGLQSGELTEEELSTAVQMAQAVSGNPELYPQMRAFAIQQGLADAESLPEEYDEGLVTAFLVVGKAMNTDVQFQQQPGMEMQQQQPQGTLPQKGKTPKLSMAGGGVVNPTDNPSAVIRGSALPPRQKARTYNTDLHEGEYVVPAHIVRRKGTDFFDKLIETDAKEKMGATKPGGGSNANKS